jgi:hypothetical protein
MSRRWRVAELPVGPFLDGLGITTSLEEGDLVPDAIVILKRVNAQGDVSLSVAWSEGMSWLERRGMLRVAEQMECAMALGENLPGC